MPLAALVLLGLLFVFLPSGGRTHAQTSLQSNRPLKCSRDLMEKVNNGHGSELVRVIIQPAATSDTLDSTIEQSGGSSIRQFQNSRVRVVTLSANGALALSARSDVSYVSLNREVRSLGHVSATTGADAVRTTTGTAISGLEVRCQARTATALSIRCGHFGSTREATRPRQHSLPTPERKTESVRSTRVFKCTSRSQSVQISWWL